MVCRSGVRGTVFVAAPDGIAGGKSLFEEVAVKAKAREGEQGAGFLELSPLGLHLSFVKFSTLNF